MRVKLQLRLERKRAEQWDENSGATLYSHVKAFHHCTEKQEEAYKKISLSLSAGKHSCVWKIITEKDSHDGGKKPGLKVTSF